jgi:hypothetical protein
MVRQMTYRERERVLECIDLLGKVNPDDSILSTLVEEAQAALASILDTNDIEGDTRPWPTKGGTL